MSLSLSLIKAFSSIMAEVLPVDEPRTSSHTLLVLQSRMQDRRMDNMSLLMLVGVRRAQAGCGM